MPIKSSRERERWLPVPVKGYEHLYEVSDLGRVRSSTKRNKWPAGHLVKCWPNSDGYPSVILSQGDTDYRQPVHKLVLLAFVGIPKPPNIVCRHLDGDRRNSRLSNLCWGTCQENSKDMLSHGTVRRGESAGSSKLTEKEIRKIRKACIAARETQQEIANRFGIHRSHLCRIVAGTTWKHLD